MYGVSKKANLLMLKSKNANLNQLASILYDLNKLEQRPQKQMIVFKPRNEISSENNPSDLVKKKSLSEKDEDVPVLVSDWFDHPLVQGPRYERKDLTLYFGHELDDLACGVQLIGLEEEGEQALTELQSMTLPRRYLAQGRFGTATVSHGTDSKVVDRSTWDHITAEQVDRVLTVMQGVHRNTAIKASGVVLNSQRAYELASKGLLKPTFPTEDIMLDSRLVSFKPPNFSIEVTCINESCYFVRRVIHMIGCELKSTAVCTHLQRQADGVFTYSDPHTLLGRKITANNVINSIKNSRSLLDKSLSKQKDYFESATVRLKAAKLPVIDVGDEPKKNSNKNNRMITSGNR